MANCLIGWPNRFTFGRITASAQEAALPATNLANDQGSADQGFQCPGTSVRIQVDLPTDTPCRIFGLFRTNLTATAKTRWVVRTAALVKTWEGGTFPAGVVAGYGQTVTTAPPGIVGGQVYCDITDPDNPDGFLNIPLAYAGPAWQPVRNFDYASAPGRVSQSAETATRSGGVVTRSDWVKRTFDLSLSGVKAAEVWDRVMDLDLYARRGNNVLFVSNPGSAVMQRESLFGQVKPESGVTYPHQAADARGWRATITERL